MLNKIIKYARDQFNQIKHNDVIIVKDSLGNETTGRLKEYTPNTIVIEKVTYVKFDAQKVTIEKIN